MVCPAGQRVDINYLCDPLEILMADEQYQVTVLGQSPAGDGALMLQSCQTMAEYDHLIVAVDRQSGAAIAFLGLHDVETDQERVLLLNGGFARTDAAGRSLGRRMLAALMLRVAGLNEVPNVLAACTSDPAWLGLLHDFGRRFTGAACYPEQTGAPVRLLAAALARRVARAVHPRLRFDMSTGLVQGGMHAGWAASVSGPSVSGAIIEPDQHLGLVDLRQVGEGTIVETAVRMYRAR